MLFEIRRIDDQVVNIDQHALPFVSSKDFVHESLEYAGTISKTEWHPFILVKTLMSAECSLETILLGYLDLIETFVSIEGGEIVLTGEL
jgi:hypothetical protein